MARAGLMVVTGLLLGGAAFLRLADVPVHSATLSAAAATAAPAFNQQAFWRTSRIYCDSCHTGPKSRAGLNLEALDLAHLDAKGDAWEKVLRKLRTREMPPLGMPRPDPATYQTLVSSIEAERNRVAEIKPNPGRPALRRLNRAEYGNAIRDLLSVEVDVAEMLPADDIGYGFDNIGDVLQVSPLLMERYLSAAAKISRMAVGDTTLPASYQTYTVPRALAQQDRMNETMPFGSRGGTSVRYFFPVDGEYEISVGLQRGRYDQFLGLERERKLDLRLDGQRLELFTIESNARAGQLEFGRDADPD